MKSTFKIAIFLCLIVCVLLLAVSCNQKDETSETTNQETTTTQETTTPEETLPEELTEEDLYPESIKQLLAENKPYSLEFVSSGDGTCYVSKLYLNNRYETEFDVIIPEKSPAGDVVTGIDLGDSLTNPEDIIPKYMTKSQMDKVLIQVKADYPYAEAGEIDLWWRNAYQQYDISKMPPLMAQEYIKRYTVIEYVVLFKFDPKYSHTNDTFKRIKMTGITPYVTKQYYEEFIQEAREAGAPEEVLIPYKELIEALPTYANYTDKVRYLQLPSSVSSIDVESLLGLMLSFTLDGKKPTKGIVLPELDLETTQTIEMYLSSNAYRLIIFSLGTSAEGYEDISNFAIYSEEEPQDKILAWHYVDGVPTLWK